MFSGFDFYFVPKKQIQTQVEILKRNITKHSGTFSEMGQTSTTHIVYAKPKGARRECSKYDNDTSSRAQHIRGLAGRMCKKLSLIEYEDFFCGKSQVNNCHGSKTGDYRSNNDLATKITMLKYLCQSV